MLQEAPKEGPKEGPEHRPEDAHRKVGRKARRKPGGKGWSVTHVATGEAARIRRKDTGRTLEGRWIIDLGSLEGHPPIRRKHSRKGTPGSAGRILDPLEGRQEGRQEGHPEGHPGSAGRAQEGH